MTGEKRGIVDPWRKVDPFVPKRHEQSADKRDIIDSEWRDEDLVVPGHYTIRSKHVSFEITSKRIDTPKDALVVLVDCILELSKNKHTRSALCFDGIGASNGRTSFNVPTGEASKLEAGDATIWFAAETFDRGMAKLGRILRGSLGQTTGKKYGIVAMLKA